jgi:dihydroneopterin aldolase
MTGSGGLVLELRGLRLVATHGVLPEEQDRPQPLEVDVDLELADDRATVSDDLADTADYGAAVLAAVAEVGSRPRRLLEALASDVADRLLADPAVAAVTVAIRKLRPPVAADLATAGVRLHRRRSGGPPGAGNR